PDALYFLESDSPAVTEERIRQAIEEAADNWSPRTVSSFGSNASRRRNATNHTAATTPDYSESGNGQPQDLPTAGPESTEAYHYHQPSFGSPTHKAYRNTRTHQTHGSIRDRDRYGTPEMSRGPAKHPHVSPSELQPRLVPPGQGYPKHLPRAEKLPMSGYELLAAKLSTPNHWPARRGSSGSGSQGSQDSNNSGNDESARNGIKPIYRKFEALNHRLLLHLQDELSELEEQLHRLDTADTQTRRLQNCILPASRRAEFMAGGELQWRKTDLLGKVGFKLGQYNNALEGFTNTLSLSPASVHDIEDYRTYLATHNPIAEMETRFLDPTEDLVCLSPPRRRRSSSSSSSLSAGYSPLPDEELDGPSTPVPHRLALGGIDTHEKEIEPSYRSRSSSYSSAIYTPENSHSATEDRSHQTSQPNTQMLPTPTSSPTSAPTLILPARPHSPDTGKQTMGLATQGDKNEVKNTALLVTLAILLAAVTLPLVTDLAGRVAVASVVGLVVASVRRG
ncbi:uncharacterized protein C8A04DRAFT_14940, partial [Dichotomopilus funicola]